MPGWQCVVQDCDQAKDEEAGISIHNSPYSGSVRTKWRRFVELHRKNWNPGPVGKFAVCSDHFETSCFTRAFPMKGVSRRLKPGSVPTIWKKTATPLSERSRRRVSELVLLTDLA